MVVVVAVVLGACSSGTDESSGAEPAGVDVGLDGGDGNLTIEKDDGSFSSATGVALPDDFPDAVELPDDYAILTANRKEVEGEVGFIVIGSVDAAPADVVAEIEDLYGTAPTVIESDDATNVNFDDVDGHPVRYSVSEDDDGNAVLTVSVDPTAA